MVFYEPDKDAYVLLGVRAFATQEEIEAAFRRSVLSAHPDKSKAPDAAEKFRAILAAAEILRDPVSRKDYDRGRALHHGASAKTPMKPATASTPAAVPPPWLDSEVRIVHDSIIFPLVVERPSFVAELAALLSFLSLAAAALTSDLTFVLLAVIGYAVNRVHAREPRTVRSAWAKVVPAMRVAEYSAIDPRAGLLVRYQVPFGALTIAIIERKARYRVEIRGFPKGAVPLLKPTRDLEHARRCARDASAWLGMPLARAA